MCSDGILPSGALRTSGQIIGPCWGIWLGHTADNRFQIGRAEVIDSATDPASDTQKASGSPLKHRAAKSWTWWRCAFWAGDVCSGQGQPLDVVGQPLDRDRGAERVISIAGEIITTSLALSM
jgi:hypothetical protein